MKELFFHWIDHEDCDLGYKCCPTIKPCTLSILRSFYLIATTGRKVFCHVWKENLSFLISRHDCAVTQENIIKFVWKRTIKYCVELIARLEHGKIILNEVERLFCDDSLTDIQLSCESLVKSCSSLPKYSALKFCNCECCTALKIQQHFVISDTSVNISSDISWIQTVCKTIGCCRLFLECAQAIRKLCDEDHLDLTAVIYSIQKVCYTIDWGNHNAAHRCELKRL